ncbi:hypothetical protein MD484_g8053, partial [Candolleomyces efflorescens]
MSEYNDPTTTLTLPSPPLDSISSIRYHPTNPDLLLVSSWDATVRYYESGDIPPNTGLGRQSEQKAKFDHRAPVLAYNLITGSWDRTLRFWDPRAPTPGSPPTFQTSSYTTPERIYALDLVGNTLVVAMASRLFHIYDIRKMDTPAQQRESSLKYMTRSLACMPDGQGYATASVEGRIAVEYFDPRPEIQEKKYAFKCHRQTIGEVDHVWPVNCLAFHPVYNTFASSGSDGTLSIWDHKVKKRLRQYPKYPNAVSAIAFNCDGTKIAVGASYTWDEGEEGLKSRSGTGVGGNGAGVLPWLGVRKLGEEVRPKGWSG